MTLNFISGSTTIATVYVKNSDDSDALEQIIHDDLPSLVIGVTVR